MDMWINEMASCGTPRSAALCGRSVPTMVSNALSVTVRVGRVAAAETESGYGERKREKCDESLLICFRLGPKSNAVGLFMFNVPANGLSWITKIKWDRDE